MIAVTQQREAFQRWSQVSIASLPQAARSIWHVCVRAGLMPRRHVSRYDWTCLSKTGGNVWFGDMLTRCGIAFSLILNWCHPIIDIQVAGLRAFGSEYWETVLSIYLPWTCPLQYKENAVSTFQSILNVNYAGGKLINVWGDCVCPTWLFRILS